jgi:VanZ family protein
MGTRRRLGCGPFLLSAWPDPGGIPAFPFSDKVTHVGLYGILGIALGYGWSRSPRPIAHGILIALGALYGVTDEWHQVFVPGRVPDVADWLVDVLGLILGYGAVVVFIYRLKRPIQMNGTE